VLGFAREDDARRVYAVLEKRFAKFGLKLRPEKTRLIKFSRPRGLGQPHGGSGTRRSFDFLGLAHYRQR